MRQMMTALLLIFSLAAFGQKFEFDYQKDYKNILKQTIDTSSHLNYDTLLARFQSNDTSLTDFNVLTLLIGFTNNEHFKPYSYLTTEREIYALNDRGDFEGAIAVSDSFLRYVPVSQQALIEKSYAFYKLGQKDSAQHYLWQCKRILRAMYESGDGLTPETAFFALGPADGQNFVRKHLGSSIGSMGSGRDKYGNFVDILEMVWEDKETGERRSRELYFQIEHASNTMFGDLNLDELIKDVDKDKN